MMAFAVALAALGSHSVFNMGVVTCSQQNVIVVERLGKFHRMLAPGLHFAWPWPLGTPTIGVSSAMHMRIPHTCRIASQNLCVR